MEVSVEIGSNIKKLRKINHLSQSELAKQLNTTQSAIANYENNHRQPNLETLLEISTIFKVSVDTLLGRIQVDPFKPIIKHPCEVDAADAFLKLLLNNHYEEAKKYLDNYLENHTCQQALFLLLRYSLTKLGWLWEIGEITIAKEHQISHRISYFIDYIEQKEPQVKHRDKSILGLTAFGEKHTFGLKMLMAALSTKGYDTHFIGQGIPLEDFIEFLKDIKPDILIISMSSPFFYEAGLAYLKHSNAQNNYFVGLGIQNKPTENVTIYRDYKDCLEALTSQ